jgi:transposase
MGNHRAIITPTEKAAVQEPRPETDGQAEGSYRHHLRAEERHPVGDASTGDGMRLRDDMLAVPSGLAESRGVGKDPRGDACQVKRSGQDRLVPGSRRFGLRESPFGGAKVGPNPTDRRKAGSKHHVITDGNGIPFAVILTGANAHDVTQLVPLVEAIPPVRGKPGHPRRKPDILIADRGYDSEPHREALRKLGITPIIARRNTRHGSNLGILRWVVERTISWLHQFRRLRIRYERRTDIHNAFLSIGCSLICWNYLEL